MPTIDPSKRRYLIALRKRDDLTPAERHELEMADAAYGERWWMTSDDMRWHVNADALSAFYAEYKRWPSTRSNDTEERRLGYWLKVCRGSAAGVGKGAWSTEREQYLNANAPKWRSEDQWRAAANALGDFHRANNRWPSQQAKESEERKLGAWRAVHRKARHGGAPRTVWNEDRGAFPR